MVCLDWMAAESGLAELPESNGAHGYAGQFGRAFNQVDGQNVAVCADEDFEFYYSLNLLALRVGGVRRRWSIL